MASAKKNIEATEDVVEETKKKSTTSSNERKTVGKRTAVKRVAEAIESAKAGELVLDPAVEAEFYVQAAIDSPEFLDLLVAALKGSSRRNRQTAALIISGVAKKDANLLASKIPALVEALNRTEAQTRWQTLETLYLMVPIDLAACKKAIALTEDCLYDDHNGTVRLAAFSLLCNLGSQDSRTSKKVWPSIDDAIQCYHGDLEFQDMLNELVKFAEGTIHAEVKAALAERMKFDAENGKGFLKRRAETIVELCKKK